MKIKFVSIFVIIAALLTNIVVYADSVLVNENFESYPAGSGTNYLPPLGWTVYPALGNMEETNYVSVWTGGLLWLYNRSSSYASYAEKEFSVPDGNGLLKASFDVQVGGQKGWGKGIKLMNDTTAGISVTYTWSSGDNIVLSNPMGSGNVILGAETASWCHYEITVNLSDIAIDGLESGEYTISLNNGTPVKGRLLNGVKSLNKIRFESGNSGSGKTVSVDNVYIEKTDYFDDIFESQTVVTNDGALVTGASEFAGILNFASTLSNMSRKDKEATVLALLYRDGYLINGAFARKESVAHYLLDEAPVYSIVNFTMPVDPEEVFGDMSLRILTLDNLIDMNQLSDRVSIPAQPADNIDFQGGADVPQIDSLTNTLVYQGLAEPLAKITYAVTKDGKIPAKDMTGPFTDVYYYFDETRANGNGVYELTAKFSGIDADYQLMISDGSGAVRNYPLHFENRIANDIIEEFPDLKTLEALKPKLDSFLEAIRFNDSLYNRNSTAIKASSLFYEIFLKENLASPIRESEHASDVAKTAALMFALNQESGLEGFTTVMQTGFPGLNMENMYAYDLYNNTSLVNSLMKEAFLTRFTSNAYLNKAVLAEQAMFFRQLGDSLVLTLCEKTAGRAAGNAVIDKLKLLYSSDTDFAAAYNSFNLSLNSENKILVAEKIMGIEYQALASVKDRFIAEVNTVLKSAGRNNAYSDSKGTSGVKTGGAITLPASAQPADLLPVTYKIPEIGEALTFGDLHDAPWAEADIRELSARGIISGDGNGNYSPNSNITREEFVKIIITTLGIETVYVGSSFQDVPHDAWYYEYVSAAYAHDIVKGIGDSIFGAGRSITREDLCTILLRAAESYGAFMPNPDENLFADDSGISDYAKRSIYILKKIGAVGGFPDDSFHPKAEASRAEAARILCLTIHYMLSE